MIDDEDDERPEWRDTWGSWGRDTAAGLGLVVGGGLLFALACLVRFGWLDLWWSVRP